jgi:hypothetical protein
VTIVLTSSTATNGPPASPGSRPVAGLKINGGATLNLSAPTSGEYAGILFYRDDRSEGDNFTINGSSSSSLEGRFYFPNDHLTFSGAAGMNTECIQIVADSIELTGNSLIQNDCPESGAAAFNFRRVRLVG